MYIKDLGTQCVSETGNHSYSPECSTEHRKWDGSKQSQKKKKKTSIFKPKGLGSGPKGTMQTMQAHHGSGMGKDGDLSRKGLRNL